MKITQAQQVLKHIRYYGKISSLDAFQEYGITRLSAVIHKLKKQGLNITAETKVTTTRLGNKTNYAEYKLTN